MSNRYATLALNRYRNDNAAFRTADYEMFSDEGFRVSVPF